MPLRAFSFAGYGTATQTLPGESLVGFKLLLEGDMQAGTDYLLLEGDMQAGTDVLLLEGTN